MTKTWPISCAILPLIAILAACGVQQAAPVTVYTLPATTGATTTGQQTVTAPQPAPAPRTTATQPPPTRTGPGPAFTHTAPAGTELQSAVTKLHALGFTPLSIATYDAGKTLRVLIGARSGSTGGHVQQAFFFDGDKYLGTDAAAPSGMIAVAGSSDTDVTLHYGIYRPGDADCCPSGATGTVRFALDGGRLAPLDPIPSPAARR